MLSFMQMGLLMLMELWPDFNDRMANVKELRNFAKLISIFF